MTQFVIIIAIGALILKPQNQNSDLKIKKWLKSNLKILKVPKKWQSCPTVISNKKWPNTKKFVMLVVISCPTDYILYTITFEIVSLVGQPEVDLKN